ncbi:hypothetical protein HK097_006081 [Rhizophlyctis rosea]|uniref:Uncharacterized protein n=1 Tax=Rhizophlyctis rosea TaxID=64517 RepID=A0AAD5SF32_9FUNG|nr:hypothetical protein HK097_006081 [Rhizophlyctis rosea]
MTAKLNNAIVWSEISKLIPLRHAALLRSLSRFHATAITLNQIGRHAARDLYFERGKYALYDLDKHFRAGVPDVAASIMVLYLLETYHLAPPLLPKGQRTPHWRKTKPYCFDKGGISFGIDIPDDRSEPDDDRDTSLDWMDCADLTQGGGDVSE